MEEALSALSEMLHATESLVSPEDWNSWPKNFFVVSKLFSKRNRDGRNSRGETKHSPFSKIKTKIRDFILNLDLKEEFIGTLVHISLLPSNRKKRNPSVRFILEILNSEAGPKKDT